MPDYYRVPVTEDEIHRIQFVGGDNAEKYFKQIVSSPRPDHLAPLILFERDGDYPDELFGIVYNSDGKAVHFLYISDKSMLLPHMKKFKTGGFRISIPEFLAFKRENSNIRSFFKDRLKLPTLLEKQIEPPAPAPPTPTSRQYSLERIVVLILIALCFYFMFHKKQPTPDMDPLKQFIRQINDPEKKKKFMEMVDGLEKERRDVLMAHFERVIRDKNKKQTLINYINKSLMDDKVLLELETFFSSIHNTHTKRMLKQIIYETAGRRPPRRTYKPIQEQFIVQQKIIKQPSETKPQQFTMDKLYDFLKNNKQTIVSSYGAVSPYFSTKLKQFLEAQHAKDPSRMAHSVMTNASRLIKKDNTLTHRQLTDRLLHTITQQELQQIPFIPEPTISPVSKRRARRRHEEPTTMIQQQQVKTKQQEQKQEPEWNDLVERTARTTETELGVAVVESNIHNITHNSKTFKKLAPTLRDVILTRQIKKVNVIDAPNLLTPYFNTYHKRQKYSRDLKFAEKLRKQMDKDSLTVVVSQMNRSEWVKDDPVYFGRIGPDEWNIFLVRVGCFDETNGKDCYKSDNTGRHNECDDFVRLDVMARTIDMLQQQQHAIPEFVQWTNDKSRNWTIIDPTLRQHITRSSMTL